MYFPIAHLATKEWLTQAEWLWQSANYSRIFQPIRSHIFGAARAALGVQLEMIYDLPAHPFAHFRCSSGGSWCTVGNDLRSSSRSVRTFSVQLGRLLVYSWK